MIAAETRPAQLIIGFFAGACWGWGITYISLAGFQGPISELAFYAVLFGSVALIWWLATLITKSW